MLYYDSFGELIRQAYLVFQQTVTAKEVNPYTGSGQDVLKLLTETLSIAYYSDELPSYNVEINSSPQLLQEFEDQIKTLANKMADDALSSGSHELHEWSLDAAIRALCPLFPFLREPCNQYLH